jgi:adenylate cyclase class 2
MTIEVEQKYRLTSTENLTQKLADLNAHFVVVERHQDTYFQHPARDFRVTDEALRIRQINDRHVITYKGPKTKAAVKTRFEIETLLAADTNSDWFTILDRLGFSRVATVSKTRTVYRLLFQGSEFVIALDDASILGKFAEIELLVESSQQTDRAASQIVALARKLELSTVESRSYLRMHFEHLDPNADAGK